MYHDVIRVGNEYWHDTDDERGLWHYTRKDMEMKKKTMSRDKAKTIALKKKRERKRSMFS